MKTAENTPYITAACTRKRNTCPLWTKSYTGSTTPRYYHDHTEKRVQNQQRQSHTLSIHGGTLATRTLRQLGNKRRPYTMSPYLLLPLQQLQVPVKNPLRFLPDHLLNCDDHNESAKLRISCSPNLKGRPMRYYHLPACPENKGCPSNGPMLKNKGCPCMI